MMRSTRYTYDDVLEALVRGDDVRGSHASLAGFVREVRAMEDDPVPVPSEQLAALLEGRPLGMARLVGAGRVGGLGRAAKLGMGAGLAAAGVLAAGAIGVLPAAANNAVRDAIEVVTPVQFTDNQDHPENFGDRVSTDATGESDGENGVDGRQISDEAPGADNRGDSARPDEPPGQSGVTGQDRADQTPAGTAPGQVDPGPNGNGQDDDESPTTTEQPDHTPQSTVPPARTQNRAPGQ
ncbi:MAG TPA: hypothetical protein VH479_15355 [Acidimicrobiales bacterium]